MRFARYAQNYVSGKSIIGAVRETTLRRYATYLKFVGREFGKETLLSLTRTRMREAVVRLRTDYRLSRNTTAGTLRFMSGVLRQAVLDRLIPSNPADGLGRELGPRPDENVKAMTKEELERLLRAAGAVSTRDEILFLLMARTGLRLGEALALRWEDVNLEERRISVRRSVLRGKVSELKTSSSRRDVDVNGRLWAALTSYASPLTVIKGWIFTSGVGPMTHVSAEVAFRLAARRAGLPPHFTPHSLRHTFASQLLATGASLEYVKRMLGHASITLTSNLYGKWLPMRDQAAVDRLDV